jgi:alkyldihydroxyacetonephosphate synthase
VTCRFTHVYPDEPAPYFTVHALGEPGKIENGGTVTHHHAVGRDYRPWYDRQRAPLFRRCAARPRRRSTRRVCSIPAC